MMMRTVLLLALASLAASAQAQPTDVAVVRAFDISCYMDYVSDGFEVVKDTLSQGKAVMTALNDLVTDIKRCWSADKKVVCLGQAIRDGWEDNEPLREELLELAEKVGNVFSKSCKAPKQLPAIRGMFDVQCYLSVIGEVKEAVIDSLTDISQQIDAKSCTNPLSTKCLYAVAGKVVTGQVSEEVLQQILQSLKDVSTIIDEGISTCLTS